MSDKPFEQYTTGYEEPALPFWRPFFLALLFGIPGSILWFVIAMQCGRSLSFLIMLIGVLCGAALRFTRGKFISAALAIVIHIGLTVSVVTIALLAQVAEESFLVAFFRVVLHSTLAEFANTCMDSMSARTFAYMPFVFYVAYRISDRE